MDAITATVVIAAVILGFATIVLALWFKGDVEATGHLGTGSFSLKVKERRGALGEKKRKTVIG